MWRSLVLSSTKGHPCLYETRGTSPTFRLTNLSTNQANLLGGLSFSISKLSDYLYFLNWLIYYLTKYYCKQAVFLFNCFFTFARFRGFSIDSDLKGVVLSEDGLKVTISNPDSIEVIYRVNLFLHAYLYWVGNLKNV